jgi:histone-lysine N-methyltransferase SETMAR
MEAMHKCGFQVLNHHPYSPDLAPSDYYLFPNIKKDLRGKKLESDEEVKAAISTHFEAKDKKYFFDGIHKLIQRYDKCIRLNPSMTLGI